MGEPLKIGVMSDLTGALALFGNEMWNGLQLGFDYATDGTMVVGNRPVELIIRDSCRRLLEGKDELLSVGPSTLTYPQEVDNCL